MKKIIFSFGIMFFIFPNVNFLQAQNKTGSNNWTVNPFEEKVFVENKTQFDGQGNLPNSAILFGVRNDGVQIYFTSKGLTYRHDEFVPMSEAEKEKAEKEAAKSGRKMDAEMMRKKKTDCISMQWENANPNVQISTEDEVSNYFTYPDLHDKSGKTTIKALAYKKIIYKNLYPNIDVEYSFPENKTGIKYAIILHPGADISQVKMQYSDNGKIDLDESGNAEINSNFGNIIDHAPKTEYENGQAISSKFNITKNTVSFELKNYNHAQTVIIDPWVTVPGYTTGNPYDVDADLAGNVYIYGDVYPHIEEKLNSSGTILWTYTATAIDTSHLEHTYGDFAVDGHSQNSYLVEGYGEYGARIVKTNPLGFQLAISVGNPNLIEFWRIVFNNTTRTGVIGGGTGGLYQACVLDTTLSTTNPVNVLGVTVGFHDICLLAQDNNNKCYMADAFDFSDPLSDNILFKSPIPALVPTFYEVSDGYHFVEASSIYYAHQFTNGFNGMAVNNNYLYTYDGDILKKRIAATGSLLDSVVVKDTIFASGYLNASWGGLQVNNCNDIFVGAKDSIKQYDGNLHLVNTIPATDTVFDLKLGTNGLLYACGKGFVQSIQLSLPPCDSLTLSMTSTSACSPDSNTATVIADGGTGANTYSWSTNPVQTTATATGLSPGTYYVTVTDSSCVPPTEKDSITINAPISFSFSAFSTNSYCSNNGTAGVNVSGGIFPYTYTWSPSGQTTQVATGLSSGTYTVSVEDSIGCIKDTTVIVHGYPPIVVSSTPTNILCNGANTGIITTSESGGAPPYTYSWSPVGGTNSTASNLAAGTYTLTVTDSAGCSSSTSATITQPSKLDTTTSINETCFGENNGSVTINVSGGTSPYTYSWLPNVSSSNTATGLSIGTYSVTVTDANGCSIQKIFIITSSSVIAAFNANPSTGLSPLQVNFTNTSSGATNYEWNLGNGDTTNLFNTNTTYQNPGQYTVELIVTNAYGCSDTAYATIDVEQKSILIIPNVFSPNGDGKNDVFKVQSSGIITFDAKIFDRWGIQLFEWTNPNSGWNGETKTGNAPDGTYYYLINATGIDEKKYLEKGFLTLIR